jgi:hypothetical protein
MLLSKPGKLRTLWFWPKPRAEARVVAEAEGAEAEGAEAIWVKLNVYLKTVKRGKNYG